VTVMPVLRSQLWYYAEKPSHKAKYHRLCSSKITRWQSISKAYWSANRCGPFFMKKALEPRKVLKLNEAYTSESLFLNHLLTQPNKVEEVISIRTNGDNQSTSPHRYIKRVFIREINDIISPLSRQLFINYRFNIMREVSLIKSAGK